MRAIAAARELRDRYLEQYNATPTIAWAAKCQIARTVEAKALSVDNARGVDRLLAA